MSEFSLFDDLSRPSKADDKALVEKSKTKSKKITPTIKSGSISSLVELVRNRVEENLGKYRDTYTTITTEMQLEFYIKACLEAQCVAIDTETTGLDPMLDKIVGVCLYYPNGSPAYIPLRHKSYITGYYLDNQLAPELVAKYLEKLVGIKECEMFNAKFDTRFIKNDLGVMLHCTWDGYLAARCMNENEEHTTLKYLHSKYVLDGKEDEFSFGEIFKGVSIDLVPIDIATLYGAHDSIITHELINFQKRYLFWEEEKPFDARNGMNGVSWCFFNIEMPLIDVLCKLEDTGILLDKNYAHKLSVEYNNKKEQALAKFYELLEPYKQQIIDYHSDKLDNPINISSTTQLAILFYDILKYEAVDKDHPRGTGVEILKKWDTPLTNAILEYRAIDKLLGTYIDKLPECVNPNDGRIHCSFNQYGADTGRFSCSDPNLQNIPSHNKDIRKMFIASPGYVLMSSDFSQQEPKCLAALCRKEGDSQMYDTFMKGKDLYSEIASKAFNKPYEECLEFNPDGTTNKEGKERRTQAKSILLGVLFGRGVASIGEQLGCSAEKAQIIKDSVFRGFPAIKKFEKDTLDFGFENGFATTICGRKRRLPNLLLDEFEFKWADYNRASDALDFDSDVDDAVPDELCDKYLRKLEKARFGQKRKIFEEALKNDGIRIIDNGGKIADATRQCVNSRIQGSAADLTKLAIINLGNNEELKKLGFNLLLQIHDEVIAECPEENVKECAKLLAETMSDAAEKILDMPIKCDVTISKEWYGEEIEV